MLKRNFTTVIKILKFFSAGGWFRNVLLLWLLLNIRNNCTLSDSNKA